MIADLFLCYNIAFDLLFVTCDYDYDSD